MSQYFRIHPEHPQPRLIRQAAEIVQNDGVVVYPTDSTYAIGCQVGNTRGLERMRAIRQLPSSHLMTLLCRDLSDLSVYARIDNRSFRLLRHLIPGPFTFVVRATKEAPKRLVHPKRRTIGLRVPKSHVLSALLAEMNAPLLSTSLRKPDEELAETDPEAIRSWLERSIDLVIDGGALGTTPTSVLDLSADEPVVLRPGLGSDLLTSL